MAKTKTEVIKILRIICLILAIGFCGIAFIWEVVDRNRGPLKIALSSDDNCNLRQYLIHQEHVKDIICDAGVSVSEGGHNDEVVFWYSNCANVPKYCYIYS